MKRLFRDIMRAAGLSTGRKNAAFLKVTVGTAPSATGADFATPVTACRAALDLVLAKLPPGFIDRARFEPVWTARHRDGSDSTRKVALELKALLPPDDQWPALSPVCDLAPTPPTDLFLRSAAAWASKIARAERAAITAHAFPWRRFVATEDRRTCPEHLALHGVIRRHDDPIWARLDADFRWGCRCTSTTINSRMAERRGFVLPTSTGSAK